jgi:precorrin-2/cobalt-factor-2 C20-methyltransferase
LQAQQTLLPLVYPVTTEALPAPLSYEQVISDFYDEAGEQVAAHLDAGRDVAVICEGDPFFYGSYMYLHDRLAQRYDAEVIPGVCSMLGGASVLGAPLVYRNQTLTVLSGVLPAEELKRRLADADAAVIMKLGRNFPKVRQVLAELGLDQRALYVERATMANQKIVALDAVDPQSSPYFSLIIVPGEKWQG